MSRRRVISEVILSRESGDCETGQHTKEVFEVDIKVLENIDDVIKNVRAEALHRIDSSDVEEKALEFSVRMNGAAKAVEKALEAGDAEQAAHAAWKMGHYRLLLFCLDNEEKLMGREWAKDELQEQKQRRAEEHRAAAREILKQSPNARRTSVAQEIASRYARQPGKNNGHGARTVAADIAELFEKG